MVFQKVAIWLLNSIFSTPIAPKLLLFTFIKQHFGFGGTNIHSEILLLCLVFVNFDKKILPQPGAIWEGGRVCPKKFETIGNRISHGHSWGGRSHRRHTKRALFLCALLSIAKDAIYTFDKTQTYSLWARPQTENGQLLTGSLLPFCVYQKWRLGCNKNSETTFQYKLAPLTPQKDTLGSRIRPQKTSKLFPHHFYC